MTEGSIISSIDSDNDSDYLMHGLNKDVEGNIQHLPKEVQEVVKDQREKAKEQGGFKYIGPLKGKKMKIEVNEPYHSFIERRKGCPVEWYERDHLTRKIIVPSHKLEWVLHMKTAKEEAEIEKIKF